MSSLLASIFGRVVVTTTRVPVTMLIARPISISPVMETRIKKPKWAGPPFPKRPATSFLIYYTEQYKGLEAEEPDAPELAKTANKLKQAANRWNEMTVEEKKLYEDRAAESSRAYKEEMKEYLLQLDEEDKKKLKLYRAKMTKYRIAKREMKEGIWVEPPKRVSGYNNFMRDQMAKRPKEKAATEWTAVIAQLWQNTPELEKKEYNDKATAVYKKEKAKYEVLLKEKERKQQAAKKALDEEEQIASDSA